MVIGLSQINTLSQVCEECGVSKQHRNQFQQGKLWREKNALELGYSDLCGPINPSPNRGNRYIITFIGDFRRKAWVIFLLEKS
jgi:hypothetical protein